MGLPLGCNKALGAIVTLACSFCGLEQAKRCWHLALVRQLKGLSLEQCPAEPFIFFIREKDERMRMMPAVRVVDIIVAGSSIDCDHVHKHLNKRFPTKILGDLTHDTSYSS